MQIWCFKLGSRHFFQFSDKNIISGTFQGIGRKIQFTTAQKYRDTMTKVIWINALNLMLWCLRDKCSILQRASYGSISLHTQVLLPRMAQPIKFGRLGKRVRWNLGESTCRASRLCRARRMQFSVYFWQSEFVYSFGYIQNATCLDNFSK